MSDIPNPCFFKKVCKECEITHLADRPKMCEDIGCDKFTPCSRCGNNKVLGDDGMCSTCTRSKGGTIQITDAAGQVVEIPEQAVKNFRLKEDQLKSPLSPATTQAVQLEEATVNIREITVSMPGTPPAEYNDSEKDYYKTQWTEYEGYYRDPTAKVLLHNIIILEIELNFVVGFIIKSRGSDVSALEQQRTRLIKNLEGLRNQLPDKEALDMSDDEKSIAAIMERYIEVNKLRQVGKVSRIISPEALALAPALKFPIDPAEILHRLGFRQVDIIQACDAIVPADLYDGPKKLLEFLGFFLEEKYAMPFTNIANIDDDTEIPDVEEATAAADEAIVQLRKEGMPGPKAGPQPRSIDEDDKDFVIESDDLS